VISSPVAGLIVGNVYPLTQSTQRPSISIFVCRTWTGDFFAGLELVSFAGTRAFGAGIVEAFIDK